MIKLCRIDHRLLHGQVAYVWSHSLAADAILVASDEVAKDDMRMATMRLAKPAGVKLVIKSLDDSIKAINSGVTDKYKLLIVTGSVQDAYKLTNGCSAIKTINLGGSKNRPGTKKLDTAFYVTDEESNILKDMLNKSIELEIRQIPEDKKKIVSEGMLV